MPFERMPLEIWFDEYQFEVECDIGESGMKFFKLKELDVNLDDVDLRYGYHLGHPNLRSEIVKDYKGQKIDNVAVTTGASESNFCVIAHLVGPKDHMIVEHPTYPSLYQVARSLGRDLSLFHQKWENDFRPDMDELRKLVVKLESRHSDYYDAFNLRWKVKDIIRDLKGLVESCKK